MTDTAQLLSWDNISTATLQNKSLPKLRDAQGNYVVCTHTLVHVPATQHALSQLS